MNYGVYFDGNVNSARSLHAANDRVMTTTALSGVTLISFRLYVERFADSCSVTLYKITNK